MSGIKFYFTGDNQDVLKKINQIHTELKKVYNNKNTKIDLSAGVDFSLLGENFKRLDQQSREAFDNMSKDAQKYIKEIQQNILSLQQIEKMQAGLNSLYEEGNIDLNAYIQSQARLTVLHEELAKGINESRAALEAETTTTKIASDSIAGLHAKVLMLTTDYMNLSKAQREGTEGAALLKNLQETQTQLDNASLSMDKYASGAKSKFDSLGMSITQIARELPSLAMGPQIFFLAISNNIGPFQDALASARKEYKDAIDAGQKGIPVWKQLLKSLTGAGPILAAITTLFVVFGDKIFDWIGTSKTAEGTLKKLYTQLRDLNNVLSTSIEQSAGEVTKLNSLYKIATDVTKSTKERNSAVKELKRVYPEHLKNLSDESIKNGEVSKAIKEQTNQIIANAKATAAADQIAKNWYKSFQAGVSKNIAYIKKQRLEQKLLIEQQNAEAVKGVPEAYEGAIKQVNIIRKKIKETDNEIKKQEVLQNSYRKSSKALEKLVTVSGLGGKYEDPDKKYNSIVDQQKRINELLGKQALERSRKEEDLENQAVQSRIDAMADGEAKIIAQRELDNKKEIQALKRQKEDYIRAEIEYQRKIFDEQEELNAKRSKDYKKKAFDPSSVKVDTSKFNELISNELIQQSIAPYKEEVQAWNEYLVEYGNFQQKKVAINAEYNQKIAEATTKGEKESLKKELDSKLKEVTFDELKKTINFADIFGDLNTQSTETLTKMRDKLKEIINNSAKDLKPTDLKELQEAFSNIDLKIAERNPFGELKQGIEGYKNATEAVIKAQEDLNTIQEGGEVVVGTYTDETGKLITKLLTQEQAERNLSDAQKGRLESQGKLTKAVNSIGQQGQQLVNAGNNLVDMLTNLGVEVPESISGALSGLGQIMNGLESIDLTKPFSIISSTTGILAGITKTISSFFGGPDGTAYYEGVKEQLEAINEVYDRIIDKSKEDIVFGGGFASVQAATQAMDNYEKKVINLQKIAAASGRAGASWKSHSAEWHSNKNVGAIGGFEQMSDILGKSISSMTDLYSLSGDELFLIQSRMPEAWSLIDARIRENLDSIVACKDEANELRDALNQAMTGVDFDSFYNGFIDQLSDMDTSFEDMCDNFEDYLRKSIMAGLVASQYQDRINALYEQWSDAARSDSKITKNEADLLKEQYQQIVEDMMRDREEMFKTFGWDTSATSQESSKKGFATASQDSIDELNGRFTALQISGEESKIQLILLNQVTNALLNVNEIGNTMLNDILNQHVITNNYLDDIVKYTKALQEMKNDLAAVKNNTAALNTRR